jgi:cysteinyl-tRNA synthetase
MFPKLQSSWKKSSKRDLHTSRKNFQTIKDALKKDFTPRGMRIVFLMGRWNDGVEISPDLRTQADVWDSTVNVSIPNYHRIIWLTESRISS